MSLLALFDSFEYLCHECTAIINLLILYVREPTLDARFWRLKLIPALKGLNCFIGGQYSAWIVFRRKNLTSANVRFWRLKSIPALWGFKIIIASDIKTRLHYHNASCKKTWIISSMYHVLFLRRSLTASNDLCVIVLDRASVVVHMST